MTDTKSGVKTAARRKAARAVLPTSEPATRARASESPRRSSARGKADGGRDPLPSVATNELYLTGESERAIYNRLSRLEGQVRGVKRMLAERKSCDEMLVQVSALKQAVNGIAAELLQAHMETCVLGRVEAGQGREALASLRSALTKVMKHG